MATTGTLTKPPTATSAERPPNRVAQAAAISIAEAEARAAVLAATPQVQVAAPSAPPAAAPASPDAQAQDVGLDDVDLSDAPALRPMKTLRVHQRTKVLADCLRLAKKFETQELDTSGGLAELDPDMLEAFGEVDLFMEAQVVDAESYRQWSTESEGMDALLRVLALFGKFTERLGG